MAVVIETTAGDLTVDLFVHERPRACLNFLKLCRLKYYNFNLFHTIEHGFIAQTGDPSGAGDGGASVWGVLEGSDKRFFAGEYQPKIRHSEPGLLSMVSLSDGLIGSQFFITLGEDLTSLDGTHCVIGQVTEGQEVLRVLNETICDTGHRPYQDVRITHTVVLEDPFENPRGFREASRSPSPSAERLQGGRIGADEDIDDTEGKTEAEVVEMMQEREAKARATILEIVGDLPDAEMAPPENVLFVCKLNPVTSDEDLEIIFSRFGRVVGCEVIRDRVSGDSLQYAFVEFEDSKTCESAYFKMDNVLIDDRRIHVDFSQSVAKVQWKGKGKGLVYKDGQKGDRLNFGDLKQRGKGGGHQANGRGQFKGGNQNSDGRRQPQRPVNLDRSRSPLTQGRQEDRDQRSYAKYNRRDEPRQRSPRRDIDRQGRMQQDRARQMQDRNHHQRNVRDHPDDRRERNTRSDYDRGQRHPRDRPSSKDRRSGRAVAKRTPSPNDRRPTHRSPESRKEPTPERSSRKDRSPGDDRKTSSRRHSPSSSARSGSDENRSSHKKSKKSKKKLSKDKKKKKSKSKKSKTSKKSAKRSSGSSSDSDSSSSSSSR